MSRIKGNLHEGLSSFMVYNLVLLRVSIVSDKVVGENQINFFIQFLTIITACM
jgi:hypothetical protein